jgi:hypothetical protein
MSLGDEVDKVFRREVKSRREGEAALDAVALRTAAHLRQPGDCRQRLAVRARSLHGHEHRADRPHLRPLAARLDRPRSGRSRRVRVRSVPAEEAGMAARTAKTPPERGFLMIGAPRFELGTSSPPDCSAFWRGFRASGGRWLGYAESGTRQRFKPLASTARFPGVWVRIGYMRLEHPRQPQRDETNQFRRGDAAAPARSLERPELVCGELDDDAPRLCRHRLRPSGHRIPDRPSPAPTSSVLAR